MGRRDTQYGTDLTVGRCQVDKNPNDAINKQTNRASIKALPY